jgi:hypothetical protein
MLPRWSRRQAASAIVAALALLAVVLGCGSLRAATTTGASQPPVAASSASPVTGPTQLTNDSVPVRRMGVGSTVNDDNAFKSGGLKRGRATPLALSTPRSSGSAAPPMVGIVRSQHRVNAPARAPASSCVDQNTLIRFCVARC